jgi:peroxiredoxin
MPVPKAGQTAPTFQLATSRGEALSFEGALGKGPLLLGFFKVSCPTCQYTFPFLERLHQQLNGRGAQIWGIAQDNAQHAAQFARSFSVTFPILIDDSPYKTSRAYGLEHVPSLFLIAPDGRIELTSEGFCKSDLAAIQKFLTRSLSIVPVALFLPTERVPEYKPG